MNSCGVLWAPVDYLTEQRVGGSWLLLNKLLPDVDFNKHHTVVPLPEGAMNFLRQQSNQ